MLHSTKEDFKMSFNKLVQPGMIKIFDLNFYFNEKVQPTENILSLIGLVDDEFVIDKGTWSYPVVRSDQVDNDSKK